MKNYTVLTTFILVGLTDDPNLQILFIFLFITYLLNVIGNLTIITLTFVDSCLRTPMYFFLRNFSFLEVSFTTVCIPRYRIPLPLGITQLPIILVSLNYFLISSWGRLNFSPDSHVL